MKKENAAEIIGHIDEKYIDEATLYAVDCRQEAAGRGAAPAERPAKAHRRVRWGVLAACVAALAIVASGAAAFAVEAEEYKAAAAFFEENGLSTEGLTRSEIKAVYRDITAKSFTNEKTAEVLKHAVPGWEIEQNEPTPEELASMWDVNLRRQSVSNKGISYRIDSRYVKPQQEGLEVFDASIVECYRNGDLIWSTEIKDFYVTDCAYTKEGTAIWGQNSPSVYSQRINAWIALADEEGNVMWQKRLDRGFKRERVAAMLYEADGTWAVISRGYHGYICLSRYDADGNELSFHKTDVTGYIAINNVARLGDGYLLQLHDWLSGDITVLRKMSRDGTLTDSFSYEAGDCDYHFTDMAVFKGQVYLSAYAVPKQQSKGGRYEIADILEFLFSEMDNGRHITSEELTHIIRDNYTAILLVCDPEGGAPKTFYSAKGSLGGKLTVSDEDRLEWKVESIASTFYSHLTSAYTIGGTCKVFEYSFDASGNLVGRTDTGETVPFTR